MKEIRTNVGVVIGRFQIHTLHTEHIRLISHVLNNHDNVIVFLGTTPAINTRRNPLDFITRKVMLEEHFGTSLVILPLLDRDSDKKWSESIDSKIAEVFPGKDVTLYGSRDSFIPHYLGKGKTCVLEPDNYISATNIRELVSKKVMSSSDFRAGVIYSVYSHYPTVYSTVDLIILNNSGEMLLGKRTQEDLFYRFVGGFVDTTDNSDLSAAKREGFEETGLELGDFEFICSKKISDWRYKNSPDRSIMTRLYSCKVIFGAPCPGDDMGVLKWVKIEGFNSELLVDEHKNLFIEWKQKILKEK